MTKQDPAPAHERQCEFNDTFTATTKGWTSKQPQTESSLRQGFHDWMESVGFQRPVTPARHYPGSHIQLLWECWLAATQAEYTRRST